VTVALAERLAGADWGHLVGEALGVPYEFTPGRRDRELVEPPVDRLLAAA
jgi:hypothetical protein